MSATKTVLLPTRALTAPPAVKEPTSIPPATTSGPLRLRIDDHWYNLTNWCEIHPGGKEILYHLNGEDATDAFYSLHSDDAVQRLARLPRTPCTAEEVKSTPAVLKSFRALRAKLVAEGWWQRNILAEFFFAAAVYGMVTAGTYFALTGNPALAILLIAVAMQQAGWTGHDYNHGRGKFCEIMGQITAGVVNAFSPKWWSNKHNTHHVYTNHVGLDLDIANEPVFHLFFPTPGHDAPLRRFQWLYFFPVAAFLYISWRIQSFMYAWERKNWKELSFMIINYIWLMIIGWKVALFSIYFAGLLVAVIVTASHQSEEMIENHPHVVATDLNPSASKHYRYNFVTCQFDTTRDCQTVDYISEYLWGGMQYQLEHHLFPTMPKYYYRSLAPIMRQWAKENGLNYKCDGMIEIIKRNIDTLYYYSRTIDEAQLLNQKINKQMN